MALNAQPTGSLWLNLLAMLAALALCAPAYAEPPVVAVLNDHGAPAFELTQRSFAAALEEGGVGTVVPMPPDTDSSLGDDPRPALVFALGSSAVRRSRETFVDRPLLATMIVSESVLESDAQATAVLLSPSPATQLKWHKQILPGATRVGVLFDPEQSQAWVDEAEVAASRLGLTLVTVPVRTPRELPAALKSLARRADSILGIPDSTVYSSKTAKAILISSFRNRIPFVGMSSAWVKAGALFGIDWDYEALGRQCATIAQEIISGSDPGAIKPRSPDKLVYQLNLRTAKQLNVEISPDLIDGAAEVYN